ncbi:BatD family protein [Pelagicoccus mobilis]|uniref:BatD family protein n=1 Tax=Pelagicoccus mobilis TaxID=415221 RepID=A0A934S056_9BACT|nr:BatD family protein [Pelagicoccus mobilis]MBK1877482.1 BatD family protein [Pelagicoccus mobilis]
MKSLRIQFIVSVVIFLFGLGKLDAEDLELSFKEAAWFTDEIATAYIFLDVEVEPEIELPESGDEVRIYDRSVVNLEDDSRGGYAVVLEFVPRRAGVRTFPSITVKVGDAIWESRPKQFLVSETIQSDRMKLEVIPNKTSAYQGEPVRIDFRWTSDLPVDQMRAFRLAPSFFNDSGVKVFVPRSQVDPDVQFGLPVGGRRVISHRIQDKANAPGKLGIVEFSVWVAFEEAGRFEIPPVKLLCSLLEKKGYGSHQYASYFNNSLFEPVDRTKAYQKLETRSDAFAVEVMPLSDSGRLESFSGLFSPDSIEVSVAPLDLKLGQLMEIRVDVKSEVCSEMLELPPIALQSSLRHRFWVAEEMSERWQPDGRSFVARARPLTVETRFFPSLSFQVFDSGKGEFRVVETGSIPLRVESEDGRSYFSVENLPGAKRVVEASTLGVWHNEKGSIMSDLGHGLISFFSGGALVFLVLCPVLFFVLTPWVRELRRRVEDEPYGKRRAAYARFGVNEVTVESLRGFVAECFERPASSLTARDAGELLREKACGKEVVEDIEAILRTPDEPRYSERGRASASMRVDESKLRSLGKSVYQALNRALVLAIGVLGLNLGQDLEATSWDDAEAAFQVALEISESGAVSSVIEERFAEAALSFEACAESGIREGASWYNSGNAWFKAGEIGRAIAAYRRAQAYRPFDDKLSESLSAARALRVDVLGTGEQKARPWPSRWSWALFSVSWIAGWLLLLLWRRYRHIALSAAGGVVLATAAVVALLEVVEWSSGASEGVLIAEETFGRKGPGYAYQSAFLESLHSGVEFEVLEARDEWLRVSLGPDGECWLPVDTVEIL